LPLNQYAKNNYITNSFEKKFIAKTTKEKIISEKSFLASNIARLA
jgi:hypothetical protein